MVHKDHVFTGKIVWKILLGPSPVNGSWLGGGLLLFCINKSYSKAKQVAELMY